MTKRLSPPPAPVPKPGPRRDADGRRIIEIRLPNRETVFAALACLALILFPLVTSAIEAFDRLIFGPEKIVERVVIPNAQLANPKLEARVEALLARMRLDEKIGQLTQYTSGEMTGPGAFSLDLDDLIARGSVGSLFNTVGAAAVNRYQRRAVEKSRLHIPLLFGYDVIHGQRTIFPVPLALASTFNPELVQATARQAAIEASEDGVRWVFSPMVDIARDARWGRITEGAGEDTYLASALAAAYVRGYQGTDLSRPDSVAACVKHFAAYGAPNAGREYNTVDMSELTLRQVYLPPYRAAIDAGAATVMSAFNPLNGVPATANYFTLTKILRNEWRFNGFVVSDFGAVKELTAHGIANTPGVAARKAISAGVDMDMQSDYYRTRLAAQVKSLDLNETVIDDAVRRVLRVKFALGLFEHPYAKEGATPYKATPEKRALARRAAEQSIVLLKNGRTIPFAHAALPIAKGTPTIALIGPLADSQPDMLGSWSAMGDAADVVTLRTALGQRCATNGTKLLYAPGTDILSSSTGGFAEAVRAARQASVVVVALGEAGSAMSGESTSLTRLDLPGNQQDLLEAVMDTGKPVILVIFSGRPLAIKWAAAHVPAIVEAWYPGLEAGPAVADILFGDVNPSGKLPVTIARAVGQLPIFYNQLPTGRPADEVDLTHPPTGSDDKYFSRYIDETNAPLYPFGFGLSYTQFDFSNLKLSAPRITIEELAHPSRRHLFAPAQNRIGVTATVKNTGSVTGTTVAQLYIRNIGGSVEEPVRELKGFQRVTLQPGESRQLEFSLGFEELSYYNLELARVIEPTEYRIWVGDSSTATLRGEFQVVPGKAEK